MRKGISGFPSLIYLVILFLIVVAIAFLLYFVISDKSDVLFNAIRDIFKGFQPNIG